jgi:hypothetical protein
MLTTFEQRLFYTKPIPKADQYGTPLLRFLSPHENKNAWLGGWHASQAKKEANAGKELCSKWLSASSLSWAVGRVISNNTGLACKTFTQARGAAKILLCSASRVFLHRGC